MSIPPEPALRHLLLNRSTLVCCGPGGVGKTTVAAALGLEAARLGRRCVVVTVDPARRLADALGIEALGDEPTRINQPGLEGELWASMLDVKHVFDGLVRRYAPRPGQAEAILANAFYQNLASGLSGMQEYMAMEKLFDLSERDAFDLIVVDTPPNANAVDFVQAPTRLIRFLDNPVFRLAMLPARSVTLAGGVAGRALLRAISKVVGSNLVADAVAFLQAFEGMEAGFRQRAAKVQALLADRATAFILVTAPQAGPVAQAHGLQEALAKATLSVEALVVNRVHPRFSAPPLSEVASLAATCGAQFDRLTNLADLLQVAQREDDVIAPLVDSLPEGGWVTVPLLVSDVHDLPSLDAVGAHLVGRPAPGINAGVG